MTSTSTEGEDASAVRVPTALERSLPGHVYTAPLAGAVAPGPPPAFDPYGIVTMDPPESVSPETATIRPDTDT